MKKFILLLTVLFSVLIAEAQKTVRYQITDFAVGKDYNPIKGFTWSKTKPCDIRMEVTAYNETIIYYPGETYRFAAETYNTTDDDNVVITSHSNNHEPVTLVFCNDTALGSFVMIEYPSIAVIYSFKRL